MALKFAKQCVNEELLCFSLITWNTFTSKLLIVTKPIQWLNFVIEIINSIKNVCFNVITR